VTRSHLRGIHVATVGIGDEGGTCLEGGRRDPDRAVHRVEWQDRDVLALGGPVGDVPRLAVHVVDPDAFREGIVQHRRPRGRGQGAEQRDRTGGGPIS
jgi:hypothetical protein